MEGTVRKTQYACEILGEYFPTAARLRERCQQILDKYLSEPCYQEHRMAEGDAAFFVELVRLRDPLRVPAGCYVRRVIRGERQGQIGRHLLFEYSDGTRDMIGWSKLCGGPPSCATRASDAMRQSITPQMLAAWAKFFDGREYGVCPKTGRTISATGSWCDDSAVVHHEGIPFAQIRDAWLHQNKLTADQLPLKDLWDAGGYEIATGELCESWKRFHEQVATLVVVSSRWHAGHHVAERKQLLEKTA
jgi:hypothetical protein